MDSPLLVAVVGALGVLGVAVLGWLTAAATRTRQQLDRLARENRALWYYTRHLIDWGYRPHGAGERPPDPPQSIAHLYEFGD